MRRARAWKTSGWTTTTLPQSPHQYVNPAARRHLRHRHHGSSSSNPRLTSPKSVRMAHGHETHAPPPQAICDVFKHYTRVKATAIADDADVVDFTRGVTSEQARTLKVTGMVDPLKVAEACEAFERRYRGRYAVPKWQGVGGCEVWEDTRFPGLQVYPGILPLSTQITLTAKLMHEELSNPLHLTNLHSDYDITYPPPPPGNVESHDAPQHSSFFSTKPTDVPTSAKDLTKQQQRSLNAAQFLQRLRWLTIGTQYDWRTRQYPPRGQGSAFPNAIEQLVAGLFPAVRAQSGVVLLYSAKDFMPVHRDVSEESPRGIVSITLGCDGIFIVGRERAANEEEWHEGAQTNVHADGEEPAMTFLVLRVRSGDIVHIAGETRFAWHAMPKIIAGTCPKGLSEWPATPSRGKGEFSQWREWMSSKRINISCRQVYE